MKLGHLAIWTEQIEKMKDFYERFFAGTADPKFENPVYQFQSYFIRFEEGAKLEIMQMPDIPKNLNDVAGKQHLGLIHFAFEMNSRDEVHTLTEAIRQAGYPVIAEATDYPDGYYETVIGDPDGNRIEISYYFGDGSKTQNDKK